MLPGLAIIGVSNFGVQAGGSETPVFSLDICRTSRLFDWNMRTRDMHTVYDVEFRCSGSMRCLFHVALKAFESGPDHSWPLLLSFQNSACGHPPPTPPQNAPTLPGELSRELPVGGELRPGIGWATVLGYLHPG